MFFNRWLFLFTYLTKNPPVFVHCRSLGVRDRSKLRLRVRPAYDLEEPFKNFRILRTVLLLFSQRGNEIKIQRKCCYKICTRLFHEKYYLKICFVEKYYPIF